MATLGVTFATALAHDYDLISNAATALIACSILTLCYWAFPAARLNRKIAKFYLLSAAIIIVGLAMGFMISLFAQTWKNVSQ